MEPPSDLEKRDLLSQILNSPEFRDSKRYQQLLQYLVEKASAAGSPKETEIAHDLFGRDSTFDPNTDPVIRSYISNLRKKLEHYYLTTDDPHAFRIEIPKGQYLITYVPADHYPKERKKELIPRSVFLIVIGLLVIGLLYQYFSRPPASTHAIAREAAPNLLWKDFLAEGAPPPLVVLGDYRLLSERGKLEGRTFLRVPQVNTEADLQAYAARDPAKYTPLEISQVTFIGAGASVGLAAVLQVFGPQVARVTVKLSSELKWDDLDNHSIVYVGTFKTLYKLDTLIARTNIRYKLSPNVLEIVDKDRKVVRGFDLTWRGGNYQRDYSVVIRLRGHKRNPMVFLTGFSEVGVMDAIKSATDPGLTSRLSAFSGKQMDEKSSLFALISEAEGVRYTVLRSRIEYHEMLPDEGEGGARD